MDHPIREQYRTTSIMIETLRLLSRVGASLLASTLAGCSPLVLINGLVPHSGYELESGIPYGPAERQKLDIYWPLAPAKSNAVIVFLYGGSWKSGERRNYRFVGQALASRGYSVVIPDYRLYPEAQFPDFVEDAAAAIGWVHREFRHRSGDPDCIIVIGHSAGAHIAALIALDDKYLGNAGVPDGSLAGWVGLAGPYAFDPLAFSSTRPIFESVKDRNSARPITLVRSDAPPALLIHGLADETVSPANSASLAAALELNGAPVRHEPLAGLGHIRVLLALAAPFRGIAPITDKISDFIEGTASGRGRPGVQPPDSCIQHNSEGDPQCIGDKQPSCSQVDRAK